MPKNWQLGEEEESVDSFLKRKGEAIQVGDTIEYVSNNQMGWKKYKVVIGDDGAKSLILIADYDSMMDGLNDDEGEVEDVAKGGKRRRRRKTTKKTKRRKKSRRHKKTRRGKKH